MVCAISFYGKLQGEAVLLAGDRKPSSEWKFHLDIYLNRPDAQVTSAHPL